MVRYFRDLAREDDEGWVHPAIVLVLILETELSKYRPSLRSLFVTFKLSKNFCVLLIDDRIHIHIDTIRYEIDIDYLT